MQVKSIRHTKKGGKTLKKYITKHKKHNNKHNNTKKHNKNNTKKHNKNTKTHHNKRNNKIKHTPKNRKLIQKGGRIVPITEEQLNNWMPLTCRTGMDCGPNSFTFLGYLDRDIGEFMGRITPAGIFPDVFINELNGRFGVNHYSQLIYYLDVNIVDYTFNYKINFEYLSETIPAGYGTLLLLLKSNVAGHVAVLYRNSDGEFEILDPQTQQRYQGIDSMIQYLSEGGYSMGYIIYQDNLVELKDKVEPMDTSPDEETMDMTMDMNMDMNM
jgi:hypothetical protein